MTVPETVVPMLTALLLPVYLVSSILLVVDSKLRMSPLPIFAGMWLVFYLIYFIEVSNSSFAAIYILALLIMVNLGALFGHRLSFSARRGDLLEADLLWPRAVVWATVLLGVTVNTYLVVASGVELSGPRSLLAVPNWYSHQRYQWGEGIPFPARAANALIFAGTMISAVMFAESWQARKRVSWMALLPGANGILYGMIIGSKAPIVYVLIYYMNGYFIASVYHGIRVNLVRLSIGISLAAALTIALTITAHYFRSAGNLSAVEIIFRIGTSYFLVPPLLLMEWLESSYHEVGLNFDAGIKTFQGIASYLVEDLHERGEMGYVVLFGREQHSSVYTAFRWIITDYGLLGAPLVVTAGAVAIGRAIKRLERGDARALALFFFIGNLVLFSFAGSPYKYTTHIIAIGLLYLYIRISALETRRYTRYGSG